jgi:hypothetical protein
MCAPHTVHTAHAQGNDMGNHGARLLAKALQINTSVRAVLIDRNRVGADGWADLAHSLQQLSEIGCARTCLSNGNRNGTLRQIPFPIYDILELTKHATANERAKAERLLAQVCLYFHLWACTFLGVSTSDAGMCRRAFSY